MPVVEQLLERPRRAGRPARSGRSGPRRSRSRASAGRRGSARRSREWSARGRYLRSAARAGRRIPGRAASCTERSAPRRCGGRPSAKERSEPAWSRHASRRPRVPRGRPAEGDRARRGPRMPGDSDLQPVAAQCGGRRTTRTRTSPRSARRWRPRTIDAVLIHAVYLLNCASEDPEIRAKSLTSLTHSLQRGRGDRGVGVVLHPGSALKGSVDEAIKRAGETIGEALEATRRRRLPAAPRGHRGRRRHARAVLRGARGADRRRGRRQAARDLPGLLPPARVAATTSGPPPG